MISLHEAVMEAGAARIAIHLMRLRSVAGIGRVNRSVGPVGAF